MLTKIKETPATELVIRCEELAELYRVNKNVYRNVIADMADEVCSRIPFSVDFDRNWPGEIIIVFGSDYTEERALKALEYEIAFFDLQDYIDSYKDNDSCIEELL
ncbi:hypothetical protein A2_gp252 [Shigella phage A2]|nr:hypothetical protein [Salmonella enterica]UVD36938.1 hypothetical protein A2_gp252 [Shigella phage A2]UVM85468.1 MAG: hypothetical protein [Bacteriophage sp.]